MARTHGALGKSKFISVSLEEINSKFHPNALVKIDAAYSILFEKPEEVAKKEKSKDEEADIEMKIT